MRRRAEICRPNPNPNPCEEWGMKLCPPTPNKQEEQGEIIPLEQALVGTELLHQQWHRLLVVDGFIRPRLKLIEHLSTAP